MKTIKLEFDKSETRLAGFPYGKDIYEKQVKKMMPADQEVTIVFPEQIEKVASSFVQGFFSEMIESVGYAELERLVIINSNSESLSESIKKNIY